MKTEAKILRRKYARQLCDNYVKDQLRKKGLMNHQITDEMVIQHRESIKKHREANDFEKWQHFENGEYPDVGQQCLIYDGHKIKIGDYKNENYFFVQNEYWLAKAKAWQPLPKYIKP